MLEVKCESCGKSLTYAEKPDGGAFWPLQMVHKEKGKCAKYEFQPQPQTTKNSVVANIVARTVSFIAASGKHYNTYAEMVVGEAPKRQRG